MALVQAQGVLTRIDAPSNGAPIITQRVALPLDGIWRDYAAIWRTNLSVRTVIGFLGRNIAQLGLKVYRRTSDTIREPLNDHPLATTLKRPNDYTTRYRLIDGLVQSLALYDNALWVKQAAQKSDAVYLTPVPWWRAQLLGGTWTTPDKYRITGSQGYIDVAASQCVHFRGFNPTDPRQGVSPMETLRRILLEEDASGNARESFWRNNARLDVWLQRPAGTKWSDTARERFRAQWRSFYTGTRNAGEAPILEDGMEAKEWPAATARDSQYIESRKLTREEVAAAFHIPPPMVGILDNATFSNIDTQHQMLYQNTLGPWLRVIEEEIELQLLPDYQDTENVYVEFNLAEKLKGSFIERANAISQAVGAPWLLRNEARALDNRTPVDGGDELVTPLNVLVGGMASPHDTAPPPKEQSDVARKLLADYFARVERAVIGRIGAAAGEPIEKLFHEQRWNLTLEPIAKALDLDAEQINASLREALRDTMTAADPVAAARSVFDQAKTVWSETLAT